MQKPPIKFFQSIYTHSLTRKVWLKVPFPLQHSPYRFADVDSGKSAVPNQLIATMLNLYNLCVNKRKLDTNHEMGENKTFEG